MMRLVSVLVNRAVAWLWLPVFLLLTACGGLAGEPQIVATLPPAPPQRVSFPAAAPDLAQGARIYAENCTRCHGVGGQGDGPLVGTGEGQINPPPPDFTDPVTTADQTPLNWFNTITNGRLERLMPPWRDALSEEERWAVALYTWALHYQPDLIATGQQLWEEQNVELNLPSQQELVQLTDDALVTTTAERAGIADFAAGLDESGRRAVAAFLRTRAVNGVDVIGRPLEEVAQVATQQPAQTPQPVRPLTTPETTDAAPVLDSAVGTISGTVQNGTAGAAVPADMPITLRIFDLTTAEQNEVETRETTVSADGTYTFDSVNLQAGYAYDAFTIYQGRAFGNSTILEAVSETSLNLPITIYEVTSDPTVITITGLVTQIVAASGNIQVAQVYSFTNTSDRVFSTDSSFGENSAGETRYGSVSVAVPAGAQLRGFADSQERYVIADDGSSVTDTAPVLPGEGHILHLLYTMPYTGDLTIEQPVRFAVNGPVRLLVTPESVAITSSQLPSIGPQTLRSVTYQGYGSTLALSPGDVIRYQLRGLPATSTTGGGNILSGGAVVAIVLVAVGVMIIGVGLFIYLRGRRVAPATVAPTRDEQSLIDGLVRQIAELDDAHDKGEVDEDTYRKRRKRLKTRLAELMDRE
ncbi:MAG: c-type cytochrome [Chloroflexi bacterium]|nr:c-type cytochrome [Chloroflexota bacterium]